MNYIYCGINHLDTEFEAEFPHTELRVCLVSHGDLSLYFIVNFQTVAADFVEFKI